MTGDAAMSVRERVDRSRSRAWALQVLYRWEAEAGDRDLHDVLLAVGRTRRISERRIAYTSRILKTLQANLAQVDAALTEVTKNWRLDRLSRIDRSILRIGATELLHFDDLPPKVAIQEAVRLANRYGGSESARFVNGVLDAVYHRRD
ncbi:MAG: transcription antitermination factor NusB [Gemmatimonadales bacterium]|nr:MAG: transcription antitermination factor NusB [Gemmatimonadales bacterium]